MSCSSNSLEILKLHILPLDLLHAAVLRLVSIYCLCLGFKIVNFRVKSINENLLQQKLGLNMYSQMSLT